MGCQQLVYLFVFSVHLIIRRIHLKTFNANFLSSSVIATKPGRMYAGCEWIFLVQFFLKIHSSNLSDSVNRIENCSDSRCEEFDVIFLFHFIKIVECLASRIAKYIENSNFIYIFYIIFGMHHSQSKDGS